MLVLLTDRLLVISMDLQDKDGVLNFPAKLTVKSLQASLAESIIEQVKNDFDLRLLPIEDKPLEVLTRWPNALAFRLAHL